MKLSVKMTAALKFIRSTGHCRLWEVAQELVRIHACWELNKNQVASQIITRLERENLVTVDRTAARAEMRIIKAEIMEPLTPSSQ